MTIASACSALSFEANDLQANSQQLMTATVPDPALTLPRRRETRVQATGCGSRPGICRMYLTRKDHCGTGVSKRSLLLKIVAQASRLRQGCIGFCADEDVHATMDSCLERLHAGETPAPQSVRWTTLPRGEGGATATALTQMRFRYQSPFWIRTENRHDTTVGEAGLADFFFDIDKNLALTSHDSLNAAESARCDDASRQSRLDCSEPPLPLPSDSASDSCFCHRHCHCHSDCAGSLFIIHHSASLLSQR